MKTELRIPVIYPRVIIAEANCGAIATKRLLQGTNINAKPTDDWSVGITLNEYRWLLQNVVELTGNPSLLLQAGARVPLVTHGSFGIAASCCPDLMAVLELMCRFVKLRGFFINATLMRSKTDTHFAVEFTHDMGAEEDFALDFIFSALINKLLFKDLLTISEPQIHFTRKKPANDHQYHQILSPFIKYNQPQNCLIFKTKDLLTPLPAHDPDQYSIALRKCQSLMIETQGQLSKRDAVEYIFERSPGMLWTTDQVAKALHTSKRSLQRHLKNEGTYYQEVLDEWLKELAKSYLLSEKLSVEATATLLGYNDEANFRRAFKRWNGCSPQTWRRQITSTD